jgi:hypothetical protein
MKAGIVRVVFSAASALLLAGVPAVAQDAPEYAAQGWSEPQRNVWYSTSQGSRLMPLAWMQALEEADSEQLFLTAAIIDRFRYLPFTTSTGARLPVGFAIDRQDDRRLERTQLRWLPNQGPAEPWVGMTCSACHTSEIAHGNRRLRIDGAPGLGDYQSFVVEIDRALEATRANPQKWARFAGRVLGDGAGNAANLARLGQAVDRLIAYQAQQRRMNAIPFPYGFARVDAFGHIFNKTVLFSGADNPAGNPSNAPVSYPFLWNIPQHNLVQWNGSVANKRLRVGNESIDIGAVGRNTGEVIGVFGEVVSVRRRIPGIGLPRGFRSSVNFDNLIVLERMLERLRPPAWPAQMLGEIDNAAAARGRTLFQQQCATCHAPLARDDLTTPIRADISYLRPGAEPRHDGTPNVQPGTDPVMACNAYGYSANSGRLLGYRVKGGQRIAANSRIVEMTSVTAINTMFDRWSQLAWDAIGIFAGFEDREFNSRAEGARLPPAPGAQSSPPPIVAAPPSYPGLPESYRRCVETRWQGPQDRILGYKARPLTGIWATAPYLHNGSVASLYELLLPPEQRMTSFFLGTRQYDARNVGFLTERSNENSFEFRTRDAQGNILWGNFNGGHDYGNGALSEQGRRDLVEYMKTL